MFSTQLSAKENIIYKYKKYEKFDLGELEIKGSIIAPGDLSTANLQIKKFSLSLYERKRYDDLLEKQLRTLR
jgi:hypothetical protein